MTITPSQAVPINFKKLGGVAHASAKAHAETRERVEEPKVKIEREPPPSKQKVDIQA